VIVIILAGGKAKRWKNYMGIENKYLVEIDGEPVYLRTIRLLKELGIEKFYLSSNNEKLKIHPEYHQATYKSGTDLDRFYDTQEIWNNSKEDVLFLYGDVYYTKQALKIICETPAKPKFVTFGRYRNKKYPGEKANEIFALKIKDKKLFKQSLAKAEKMFKEGKIKAAQGWQVHRLMLNIQPTRGGKPNLRNFVSIEDITTDFDKGKDYEIWMEQTQGLRDKYE